MEKKKLLNIEIYATQITHTMPEEFLDINSVLKLVSEILNFERRTTAVLRNG